MLNPESPMPLYHQLAELLTRQIRSGEYKPGQAIPAETRMAGQYHVGRPTVRQAMDVLVRKGLLERKRGSGTFVREPGSQVDLFSLAGTSQAFLTKGIQTTSKMLDPICVRTVRKDPQNPFSGNRAFFLSRLTLVREDPILIEDIYLHPTLFPGLEKMDLENQSLAQVVLDQYYLKPQTGRQTFKISFLPDPRAGVLGVEPCDPVLEVERTLHFPEAAGAIFSRLFCRTDTFVFSQTISMGMA